MGDTGPGPDLKDRIREHYAERAKAAAAPASRCSSSGALEERDYLERLRKAGFAEESIEATAVYDNKASGCCGAGGLPEGVRLISGFVRARKPRL